MRLSDRALNGRTVVAADGVAIGEVAAIFIESGAWNVESLLVQLRREAAQRIGTRRGFFRAPTMEVPVRLIQSVGDAIVLSAKASELRERAEEAINATQAPRGAGYSEPPATRH